MNSFLNGAPGIGLVRNHELRPNLMGWIQLAVFLPCFVVGVSAHAANKGAELANSSVVANERLPEKCTCVRPLVVGAVESSLFKESECRVKDGLKVGGCGSKVGVLLFGGCEPVRNEPGKTQTNASKKPEVSSAEGDTETIHPSVWLLIAGIVISLIRKPNE